MSCALPAGRELLGAAAPPLLVLHDHCPLVGHGDHSELPCGLEAVIDWSGHVPKSALPSGRSGLSWEGHAAVPEGGSHVQAGGWRWTGLMALR